MSSYNVEKKEVEDAIQQLYRDFALQYADIQKSDLSESEKQIRISELTENIKKIEQILRSIRSLSEISSDDRESLGIKDIVNPEVDENIINALVSIYVKRAKTPNTRDRNKGVLRSITLGENETLEKIDTTAFEKELRQYFTEHYSDLFSAVPNSFLSEIVEIPDDDELFHDHYGDLARMAMLHGLDYEKFNGFGYTITVQDGLVAEEDLMRGKINIFYATPDGINKRIFDLYSRALYKKQSEDNRDIYLDRVRKLKSTYISYAEENGIEITNSDVLEPIEIDMAKVESLARYINRVVNNNAKQGDYTQVFQDDIIKNYSKIMNLNWYNFGDLDSVKKIIGESKIIDSLRLKIDEDSITRPDEFRPDIAYGTPEFVRAEYQRIMQEVRRLHNTNAFKEKCFEIEKITAKKQAYRRYMQENGITGEDISIPKVEIDHEKTEMIADAIMKQYGEICEDPEEMKRRILTKLEDNWAEIVTEAQVMNMSKLFKEELKEMGHPFADEQLYVKDDFIYLGDFSGYTSVVIYSTPEALRRNLDVLDSRIASNDFNYDDKSIREGLVKYAEENNIDLTIPSVKSIEDEGKAVREAFSFEMYAEETLPDDPTARKKIDVNDSIDDIIYKMSEDVPGAMIGLTELMKSDEEGVLLLLSLDDMNIRGDQIWEAYRYLYDEDGRKFAEAVKNRDAKMVEFINEELALVGGEKAVIGGAYFDRNKVPAKYRFTEEEVKQLRAQREERIQEQKEEIDKMIDNNPAKGNLCEERTTRMGKKSIRELDDELTDLQDKERQARELCEQYEKRLPNKNDQEL